MWRRRWVRLARKPRGIAPAEFALIAPVRRMLLCILVDLSIVMFINSAMERGLREVNRDSFTGYVEEGTIRQQKIREIIVDHSHELIQEA